MKTLLIFLSFILLSSSEIITGKVVKVSDGDTITILTEKNEQIRIRFSGVDCPEKSQAFGQKAKEFTAKFCAGKQVEIISQSKDRYGRVLGVVMVDGVNVNKELLKEGLAWHYKQYDKSKEFASLESQARRKKIGLWAEKNPIAPWEFRKIKKRI